MGLVVCWLQRRHRMLLAEAVEEFAHHRIADEATWQHATPPTIAAAVEAVRAGQFSKGFEAIADQVRNLAQRTVHATREAASLVEVSANNAQEVEQMASDADKAFSTILDDAAQVSNLLDDVAQAYEECSHRGGSAGVPAGETEQSDSVSAGLADQATTVKDMIDELVSRVHESSDHIDEYPRATRQDG